MITRDQILAKVSTYEIMEHFLKEYYEKEGVEMKPGNHIYVPEI